MTQIALRANRMDPAYSIYQLKANEALVGDHKKIGLSKGFGRERLDNYRMPFDSNAGAVGDRLVFVGAFVDAFHEATFGFSFQRLAAGLSPIVVDEWSTNGPRREIALLGNLAGVAQIAHF